MIGIQILLWEHLHLIQKHHFLIVLLLHHWCCSIHWVAAHHLSLELLLYFVLARIDAACLVVVARVHLRAPHVVHADLASALLHIVLRLDDSLCLAFIAELLHLVLALDRPWRGLLLLLVFVALHLVLHLIREDRVLLQLLEALIALVDLKIAV